MKMISCRRLQSGGSYTAAIMMANAAGVTIGIAFEELLNSSSRVSTPKHTTIMSIKPMKV